MKSAENGVGENPMAFGNPMAALWYQGRGLSFAENDEQAAERYEQARQILTTEVNRKELQAVLLYSLGIVRSRQGRAERSRAAVDRGAVCRH